MHNHAEQPALTLSTFLLAPPATKKFPQRWSRLNKNGEEEHFVTLCLSLGSIHINLDLFRRSRLFDMHVLGKLQERLARGA